ncbi:hypothetical protein ACWDUN_24515 [Mycobacterium sp. NPDC003323]
MTSNKLKLIFASAGIGAVMGMAGLTVANSTAIADPALPEPTLPSEQYDAPAPVTTTTTEAETEESGE